MVIADCHSNIPTWVSAGMYRLTHSYYPGGSFFLDTDERHIVEPVSGPEGISHCYSLVLLRSYVRERIHIFVSCEWSLKTDSTIKICLIITSLAKEVMFLVALVCLFVCLFVYLFVDNITQKVMNGLG